MAVIYVPQDTRWGDLGKGLGGLLGNVVQQIQEQKVAQDVGQIYQDPAFRNNPAGLLAEVTKRHGPQGIKALTTLLDSQAKIGQIALQGAQGRLAGVKANVAEATEPTDILKAKADLAATEARTGLTQAETAYTAGPRSALTGAQVSGAGAESTIKKQQADASMGSQQAGLVGAEVDKTRAGADVARLTADQLQQQIEIGKSLFGPANPQQPQGNTGLDNMINNAVPNVTPEERARVWGAAQTSRTPGVAATKELDKIVKERQQIASRTDLLPSDMRRTLDSAASTVTTLEPFLQANSGAEGLIGGIKAFLAKKGVDQDPNLISAATAGEQNMAHFATTGQGFGGAWRVALAKDVVPTVNHTPVYNVLATEQISNEMLKRLETVKEQAARSPKYKDQVPSVQTQIDAYTQLRDKAASMWWGYDNNTPGQAKGKLHFYYQGKEVDPKTLAPTADIPIDLTKTYRMSNGQTLSGADLLDTARKAGLTPQAGMIKTGAQLLAGQ